MATKRRLLIKRNLLIQADFKKLSEEKSPRGNPKYSGAYIIERLSEKYFIGEVQIYQVLRENYAPENQIEMNFEESNNNTQTGEDK